MKTPKEVVRQELLRCFPPPKGLTERQVKNHLKKLEIASERVIRALRHWVDFNGGEGNGHG